MRKLTYYIRSRDSLNSVPEAEIRLYGEDSMCAYMQELCLYLSILAPQRLIELYSTYWSPAELPIEMYFAGEEIAQDDCGVYFKIDGEHRYILKDGNEGLHWMCLKDDIYK